MIEGRKILDEAAQGRCRALLADVMRERGESLGEFGVVLARTISAERKAFSRQYMNGLLKGHAGFPVTPEIARAAETLMVMLDGVSEVQARAHEVTVPLFTMHDLPAYAIITSKPRLCALPGCRVVFIGPTQQRYCGPECRAEAQRRRKEQRAAVVSELAGA